MSKPWLQGRAGNCIEQLHFNHLENTFSSNERFQGQVDVLFFSWYYEGDERNNTTRIPSAQPEVKKKSYIMDKLIFLPMMGEFMHELLLFVLPGMLNYKCRWGLYFNTWETAFWTLWQGCWTKDKAFISLNLSGHINPSLRSLSDEKLLEWFDFLKLCLNCIGVQIT